jgi:hypothetical protein
VCGGTDRYATRRHHVVCGLSGSTTFFDIALNGMIFGKKVIERKMCVLIFSTNFI